MLQARSWHSFRRCSVCGAKATVINVRPGIFGILMWVSSIIGLALAGLYMFYYDFGFGNNNVYVVLVFIVLAFVSGFIEIGRAEALARAHVILQLIT
jgi:hypothetical protein